MRNVVMPGSGRSGSSMIAGSLARAGYHTGPEPVPANDQNPEGFFESSRVNLINHRLILAESSVSKWIECRDAESRLRFFHESWVMEPRRSSLGKGAAFLVARREYGAMRAVTEQKPYCLKDPRFSLTLHHWKPFVNDAVFVVPFRHPSTVVESTRRFFQSVHGRDFDSARLFRAWEAICSRLLQWAREDSGKWMFLHYDQFLQGDGAERLGRFLDCSIDRSFARHDLNRSTERGGAPESCRKAYDELCTLAEWKSDHQENDS